MQTSPLQLHMTLESGSEFYYPNFDKTPFYSGLHASPARGVVVVWMPARSIRSFWTRTQSAWETTAFNINLILRLKWLRYMAVEAPPNRRATSLKSVFRVPHQKGLQSTTSYASSRLESFGGGPVWGGAPDESVLGCKVAYHLKDRAK
ncbi:hypothetical protein C8J57DRAFT_1232423 [Mycena rebaudengoi]|nr:hypothetical protein C8J57DRAFT_1232423 [Mycena rebaudengoi]